MESGSKIVSDNVSLLSLPVSLLLVLLRTYCQTAALLLLVLLRTYCQAAAHWFVKVKKTFLAGPCEAVSRLYNSVIMICLSNINLHSWIWCNVCHCITAGLDAIVVDPDGGVHSSRLRAQFANQVSLIPSVLPLEG